MSNKWLLCVSLSSAFLLPFSWLVLIDVCESYNVMRPRLWYGRRTHSPPRLLLQSKFGAATSDECTWLNYGLLVSSFSDGVKNSPAAQNFLLQGLVRALAVDAQLSAEHQVESSVVQSPCCGPNIKALETLEEVDAMVEHIEKDQHEHSFWQESDHLYGILKSLPAKTLRFVYIPTAMYALRAESTNTPGKQRQRARADAKKRRNEIVTFLEELLGNECDVLAVTLDLDDGSIKQPEGHKEKSLFPMNGKAALAEWNPHLVYVQGGNTFWLHHCMEKGEWEKDLIRVFAGPSQAVYLGSSAGAILVGDDVETACWKGWDDPSIVPGRENSKDWKGVSGLGLVGGASFFPHMDGDWKTLVEEKRKEMGSTLYCLRDEDACCVDGRRKSIRVVYGDMYVQEN